MTPSAHGLTATTTLFQPDEYAGGVSLEQIAGSDGLLFVRNGRGFAGQGEIARLGADEAVSFLRGITHIDHTGLRTNLPLGPVAIGTVPFLPGSSGEMIVPAVLVGSNGQGLMWITRIGEHDLRLEDPPHPVGSEFQITHDSPIEQYLHAVTTARNAVRDHHLTKAVIARAIRVTADQPMEISAILERLRMSFGSSYRFSVANLVGASPELLVEVDGEIVRSHPLAGTTTRTGDPTTDADLAAKLIASIKNQVEHRVVIDVVHDTLLPYCSYLDWEPEPSIVPVANVQHLGSAVEGRLSQPQPSVISLVRALSPTPALGGHPRQSALDLIAEVEGLERGRYAGAVGWTDAQGQGTWAVAIRCAEFSPDRRTARLMAGGGIVAESDPLAELAETQAKFQAMLSALIRP
jgi:isochorismate synthase